MKQFKFFAVALAALTMFSCSKENITDNPGNNAPGEQASLTIKFANSDDVIGRAATRPTDASDAKIVDYSIFLFRSGGQLDGKLTDKAQNITTASQITVKGTTAARSVYVVANAGDITAGIATEDDLKKKLVKLTTLDNDAGTGVASQVSARVFMSGNEPVSFAKDVTVSAVTVPLKFVGAKLSLTINHTGTNPGVTGPTGVYGTDYVITRAFVMNAGGVSKLFATEPATSTSLIPSITEFPQIDGKPYFVSGVTAANHSPAWTNMAEKYGVSTSLVTDFANAPAVAGGAHFYVFEQNANVPHQDKIATILVVEVNWLKAPGVPKKVYFPVAFKMTDAKKLIVRGNAYNVSITLTGDFTAGGNGGGGTPDPGEEIIASTVTVTVAPATWAGVPVDKVFN